MPRIQLDDIRVQQPDIGMEPFKMSGSGSTKLAYELRRRHVFKTLALYVVIAWAALQVTELALQGAEIPDRAIRYIWFAALAVFPLVVIFAWRYDITKEGVVRTAPQHDQPDLPLSNSDRWFISSLSSITLIICVFAITQIISHEQPPKIESKERSIAVLPFKTCRGQEEIQYLGEQLAREVITQLSPLPTVEIKSENSSFTMAGFGLPKSQIAEYLGASHYLSGIVCRDEQKLTVIIELTDKEDNVLLRNKYTQEVNELNQIKQRLPSQIAKAVADYLDVSFEQVLHEPVDVSAYEQLLIGRALNSNNQFIEAEQAFDRALIIQGDFPEALFEKALLVLRNRKERKLLWTDLAPDAKQLVTEAEEIALQQLSTGTQDYSTHVVLGKIYSIKSYIEYELAYRQGTQLSQESIDMHRSKARQYDLQAVEHFQKALTLNRSNTEIHTWLASALNALGGEHSSKAVEVLKAGQRLDPFNRKYNIELAFKLDEWGQYHEAIELLNRFKILPEKMGHLWWVQMEIMHNQHRLDDQLGVIIEALQKEPEVFDRALRIGQIWRLTAQLINLGLEEEADDFHRILNDIPFQGVGFEAWFHQFFLHEYYWVKKDPERKAEIVARKQAEYANITDEELLDGVTWIAQMDSMYLWLAGEHERVINLWRALHLKQLPMRFAERQEGLSLTLARYYYSLGRTDEAEPILKSVIESLEKKVAIGIRHPESLFHLAEAYAMIGRDNDSLEALKMAVDRQDWMLANKQYHHLELTISPFDSLLDEPRYQLLIDRSETIKEHQAANIRNLLKHHDMEELLKPVKESWTRKVAAMEAAASSD